MKINRKPRGQKLYQQEPKDGLVRVVANIPADVFYSIKSSNMSNNRAVNVALHTYFKDYYKNRLETALFTLYEVLFDIEKLKDKGQIGSIKCTADHLLQIDSYKEAIRILENSPLYTPESDE